MRQFDSWHTVVSSSLPIKHTRPRQWCYIECPWMICSDLARFAKICQRTDCCNALPDFLKFHRSKSSGERKFLEHALLRSESSTGAKVPRSESSGTFRSSGANVLQTKVPRERKLSLWTFRSQERKCRGTKCPDTDQTHQRVAIYDLT